MCVCEKERETSESKSTLSFVRVAGVVVVNCENDASQLTVI